ncbi:MAG TPA: OmpA family protein [Flavisolibacter sp.]|jgi:outer membrane protein OmpA-like peptidoglycan-associated protein|nr:OmpA family protein [Flavisolibacter sp.]
MAELNVQPKKNTSILPWILLLLGLAALIWFLTRNKDENKVADTNSATTVTGDSGTNQSTSNNTASADWNSVDFNAPAANYEEITDRNINVRGNNNYGIYGMDETVLFDENKATIRPQAEANLKQIAGSIGKRYNGGEVRVYGFTDAQGSAGYNKDLAQQRADAVKGWLGSNGFDASRISVNAVGEAQPVATNSTEAGRQQNRRVEIVARGNSAQ